MNKDPTRKFLIEQEHIERLLKRGLVSLDILDQLVHYLIEIMKESLKKKFPDATEEKIRKMMLEQVDLYKKIKNRRRIKVYGRN